MALRVPFVCYVTSVTAASKWSSICHYVIKQNEIGSGVSEIVWRVLTCSEQEGP